MLAVVSVLFMLPALNLGFFADDLLQRMIALPPDRVPAGIHDLGFPQDSGACSTVLRDFFFGCYRDRGSVAAARNYGVLPWWMPEDARIGLWRPVTAFTHWLDYQLYPDSPSLMRAQNFAWFAGAVFLASVMYRKLMGPGWAAGLAGLLLLLDANTYFPVAFIANRGFILSLCLGLACLYQHHQWRAERRRSGLIWSALFLALAVFANEGGASALAFIIAYALVLEPGPLRRRALTVVPALLAIVLWRAVYALSGSGVFNVGGYIDPSQEPLLFAREVLPRMLVLLGGQLAHVPPELALAAKPSLQLQAIALYGVPVAVALVLLIPWLRQDRTARFWCAVMVLAAIAAATVVPMSKNLGFVAVGAYGLIATFVGGMFNQPGWLPRSPAYRAAAWAACALLLLMHGPVAATHRLLATVGLRSVWERVEPVLDIGNPPGMGDKEVVIINPPSTLGLSYAPFIKASAGQPLPRRLRSLVPGCISFEVERSDERTLVIQSNGPNIFSCDDVGPFHQLYAVRFSNVFLGQRDFKEGERLELGSLAIEILALDEAKLPSRIAFRFDASLDSPKFHWLQFNCRTVSCEPFAVPAVGQRVTVLGPLR